MVEQVPYRLNPQPLPRDAEARAMGRVFAVAKPPGPLEDLPDRQIGEQSHREHDPQCDFVSQNATS